MSANLQEDDLNPSLRLVLEVLLIRLEQYGDSVRSNIMTDPTTSGAKTNRYRQWTINHHDVLERPTSLLYVLVLVLIGLSCSLSGVRLLSIPNDTTRTADGTAFKMDW